MIVLKVNTTTWQKYIHCSQSLRLEIIDYPQGWMLVSGVCDGGGLKQRNYFFNKVDFLYLKDYLNIQRS